MKLLAFDTSTSVCSVGLLDDSRSAGDQVKSLARTATMQQGKLILPMINELLETFNVKLNALDAVVFGCGPGSYTGLRIASSVAQSLSVVANLPLISISSLAAIAQTGFLVHPHMTNLLVALDARMMQVYWGAYQVNAQGYVELIGKEGVYNPKEVPNPNDAITMMRRSSNFQPLNVRPLHWQGLGNGWCIYGETLGSAVGISPSQRDEITYPSAEALLGLAQHKLLVGGGLDSNDGLPSYLR